MTRVLITGVRGKTGSALARSLAGGAAAEVVGGTTDPSRLALDGVTPVAFDWDAPATWAPALEHVDAVYLVRPDIEEAPERIASLVAQAPPDARIVLLSELGAEELNRDSWFARVERAVTERARHWTLLRPSWFMQNFTDRRYYRDAIRIDGRFTFPAGGAAVSWIDARDIAAVAERTLLDEGHDGRAYALTGPEALDLPTTAQTLATAAGRRIEYEDVSVADAIAGRSSADTMSFAASAPDGWTAEILADVYERVRAGRFAAVTDDVARVTGRPARSLERFATEHAALLA
jgi:uncharacterized protein YbjT (DUF2867 family)